MAGGACGETLACINDVILGRGSLRLPFATLISLPSESGGVARWLDFLVAVLGVASQLLA